MRVTFVRGHECYFDEASGFWRYSDTKEKADANERPCKRCGKMPTKEGHDACLGTMKGVKFACCGHGETDPYFVWDDNTSTHSLDETRAREWDLKQKKGIEIKLTKRVSPKDYKEGYKAGASYVCDRLSQWLALNPETNPPMMILNKAWDELKKLKMVIGEITNG